MKKLGLATAGGIGLGVAIVARTSLRAPVFGAPENAHPWLLSSIPSGPLLAFAILAGAALGVLASRRGLGGLLTPFLLPGLGGAVLLPWAFRLAPFLAAFSGRFLDLVLLVSGALSLWRLFEHRGFEPRRLSAFAVALAGLLLYLGLGAKLQRDVGLSGDEPHYLLIAESLLQDGDLKVEDDYRDEEYRRFYSGKIGPHLAAGTPYSVHGPGLPLLLAPGFALLGLRGVLLTEALLAALLLREVFLLAQAMTSTRAAALFAAVAFGLTAPGAFLAVSAYPELPAALVVAAVARRALDASPPSLARGALWTVLVGALPFLHVKFLPLACVLWAMLALRSWKGGSSRLAAIGAGIGLSLSCLALFSYVTAGSPSPIASYGRQRIFAERIPSGVAGMLFDQEFGLLLASPVYVLGLVGLVGLARRRPLVAGAIGLVLAAVALPGAAHPLWSGGTSPPARFLFPALPLVAVAAAWSFAERPRHGLAPCSGALLLWSVALAGAMVWLPGQPLYLNARDGSGKIWEALSSSWDLTAYLPSVVAHDVHSVATVAALALCLLAAAALQLRGRVLGLSSLVLLLLAGAWVQDLLGAAPSRLFEVRWASEVFFQLFDHAGDRFLALPEGERLDAAGVMERVRLPVESFDEDADPRHWWSRPYALPAGRFTIEDVETPGSALLNGLGCFVSDELTFASRVGLAQLQLRATRRPVSPRARMLEAWPTPVTALRSVALFDGARLHGLDDEAYLDPRGFWVRAGAKASFALSPAGDCASGCRLEIANGGVENFVEIAWDASRERLRLSPWAATEVVLRSDAEPVLFSIESERGFRPAELDPTSGDHRALGVFLRAPTACDPERTGSR